VILGPPGVGKSHLAIGLGLKAIEHGYRVLFTTAAGMIATLTKALAEGRLEDKLKLFTVPRLLIVDEIGYLPIDRQGANLFFQLISRRYEKGPMILTSNQSFGAWGEVFGDRVIATAILDRVLHHAITVNMMSVRSIMISRALSTNFQKGACLTHIGREGDARARGVVIGSKTKRVRMWRQQAVQRLLGEVASNILGEAAGSQIT